MVDLLPYRFEPERKEVDRSSSAERAIVREHPVVMTEQKMKIELTTQTGVVAESVTACQVQQSVSVAKKWTN